MTALELTEAVKRQLKITWSNEDTDAEVDGIMSRAASILNDYLGETLTYETETGRELDLYLNLCLYLYNGLTEQEFTDAYSQPLTIARQHHTDPINVEGDTEPETNHLIFAEE